MKDKYADLVRRMADEPAIARARALVRSTDARTLEEQRTLALIPAPPFAEAERAAWVRERFRSVGLADVRADAAGNVIGEFAGGRPDAAPIVVAAHLDTVFPADTPLEKRSEGHKLLIPGIADNARGLAAMLAVARVMGEAGAGTDRTVVFAATVGEEGAGDLRGVKHLFADGSALRRAAGFIALDGADARRIVARAVGSTRLRITLHGPGGHSWADRHAPNPAHALGHAIAALSRRKLPPEPAWSLNIGRIGGGTSVNAIPEQAWIELDLRSEAPHVLARLERHALDDFAAALASPGQTRPGEGDPGGLRLQVETIGRRPAGATPPQSPLVLIARAATRFIGRRPELVASSTDANIPISLGIPAIAFGAGGASGGLHTVGEWYDNRRGPDGIVRALLVIAAAARMRL